MKYIVKDTTIIHGVGKEKAKTYLPGDEIELTKEEAQGLSVRPKKAEDALKDQEDEDVQEIDIESMSKKELIVALEELAVVIPKKANRNTLIDLLTEAREESRPGE